ncbi:hypothetical protein [Paucisalibacillus globulus]|uniref:hypothetical protein n=1 Tax=Paucisalibacillus globulus TaxID=351095 RepID=UPI0003F6CF0E|nr:hypothetical protein [Paucisalibacillus globulus]
MLTNFQELDHEYFMREALKGAEKAGKRGDRAIGAVIVQYSSEIAEVVLHGRRH